MVQVVLSIHDNDIVLLMATKAATRPSSWWSGWSTSQENLHKVPALLCSVMFWHRLILFINFRVTQLTPQAAIPLSQCHLSNPKYYGLMNYMNILFTKRNSAHHNRVHNLWDTVYLFTDAHVSWFEQLFFLQLHLCRVKAFRQSCSTMAPSIKIPNTH